MHPSTPQKQVVARIADGLKRGEIFIAPTDTVYAFICLLDAPKAISALYEIKRIPEKQHLSLLCRDVAMASHYAHGITNNVFRFMKSHTPGPYTFILNAGRDMDRRGTGKKKEVGVRIVDHPLHFALMELLDLPLISTSIIQEDEYNTDPEYLDRQFGKKICAVIDDGIRKNEYSSVLDCTDGTLKVVRKGKGDVSSLESEED